MMAAGDAASRFVAGLKRKPKMIGREAHFAPLGGERHANAAPPLDILELKRLGGMESVEWCAGEQAKDAEIQFQREMWLPRLERWLAAVETEDDPDRRFIMRSWLKEEIKRLRRCLGLTQSPEEKRAQTRERVRRLRAKQRPKATP